MTAPPESASFSITAATFTGNHGAEAMLLATLQGMRERIPTAAFHVFSYYPDQDRRVARDPDVRVHSLTPLAVVARLVPLAAAYALGRTLGLRFLLPAFPPDVRALAGSDAVLDLAGVSFVEGREKFLPFNVLTLVPAFMLGVPVVKLSQAVGPFRRPLNRVVARWVLCRCRTVFARGSSTREHLEVLALGDRVRSAPDVAFLLTAGGDDVSAGGAGLEGKGAEGTGAERGDAGADHAPAVAPLLKEIARRRPGVRSVVGVCPSSLFATKVGAPYVALVEGVITRLVAQGDLVVLFPNASRGSADAGPRNNDLHVIRTLLDRLPDPARAGVVAVERDVHAPELLTLLSAMDLAVVSRFHAMVGALSKGRPVAVVGWSHKYAEVMADFGMADHVFDGRTVRPEDVLASVDAFREDAEGLATRIADKLRTVRPAAATQLDHVAELVGKGVRRGGGVGGGGGS